MRSLRGLAVLAAVAGLAAGCGSTTPPRASPSPSTQAPKPATTAPPARTPASSSPVPASPVATWPATTRTAASSHAGYLTAVSVGQHATYERGEIGRTCAGG